MTKAEKTLPDATSAAEPHVLLVAIDDEPQALELVSEGLAQEGLEIVTSTDPDAGLEIVRRRHPQIVLLDLMMPGRSGMDLLEAILEVAPTTDVILLTGQVSTDFAVEAIQKGACDYLTKPVSMARLRERVGKVLEEARERQRASRLDSELLKACQFQGMVGRSPLMLDVYTRIRRLAPYFRNVLVIGETGTGKELVARALHVFSPVASGPFAVCNCSAVVETLFETELFGYVKGAFTGANQDKVGLVEYSSGGILFLDEIGDMPLATQAKLLRVLQNQEVQRVGSPVVRHVELRVVAATHWDLRALVAQGRFREDLYYRLARMEIRLPRLADRKEDLPLLERYFLQRFATQYNKPIRGLTRRAQILLTTYPWAGNVRELENVLGNACLMAEGEMIDVHDLPKEFEGPAPSEVREDPELISLEELQHLHARRVVERVYGNKVRAAEILGVSRATLYRLLAQSEPDPEKKASSEEA